MFKIYKSTEERVKGGYHGAFLLNIKELIQDANFSALK